MTWLVEGTHAVEVDDLLAVVVVLDGVVGVIACDDLVRPDVLWH